VRTPLLALLVLLPTAALAQAPRLARADSAFAAEDAATAEREYAAVLAADPASSRATFRLAQLRQRRDPAGAIRLYERYAALEPGDAWGYIALGDARSRAGRHGAALDAFDDAVRVAPAERDAVVGRARVLARGGRTDAAVREYERWVASHPKDAEAWRELAQQRQRAGRAREAAEAYERSLATEPDGRTERRLAALHASSAPALEPSVGGSRDSDGNTSLRLSVAGDYAPLARGRLGVAAGHRQVTAAGDTLSRAVDDFSLTAAWAPRAALRVDAAGGVARLGVASFGLLSGSGTTVGRRPGVGAGGVVTPPTGSTGSTGAGPSASSPAATATVATGTLRARWTPASPLGGRASVEMRVNRAPLDATALLVDNHVVRDEAAARVSLPLLGDRVALRGGGRVAELTSDVDRNRRTVLSGGLAVAGPRCVELSAQLHQTAYAHATASGYFAPRMAQLAELGAYTEVESARGVRLAADVGAGVQRVGAHGEPTGSWERATRLWAQLALPLRPGREIRLEVDGYDALIGDAAAAAAPASGWKYAAGTLSVRWGF